MQPGSLASGRMFLVPLCAALALLCALGFPLLSDQILLRDDLAAFHLPMRDLYAQALARGQSPLWVPEIYAGIYLHGEGQLGMLHPLHLVLYRALPLALAFNLEMLAIYAGLFGGMFLFLARQSLPRTAALFGALVFMFSGFAIAHYVHPNMVAVIAHIPWLLLAIDVTLREKKPERVVLAQLSIGLLTASQVLLGHPQAVWLSSFLEGLYALFLFPQWHARPRIWLVAAAKIMGIAAGAVQLLPTWEAVFDSGRANPDRSFAYRHALHPVNLLQLLSPYLWRTRVFDQPYPQEAIFYCGAVAAVVPLWLLLRGRRRELGRLANAALILGLVAAILSLGERGYLDLLQAHTPLISRFEAAGRYIVLVHFALATGAAIVLRDLCEIVERRAPVAWVRLSMLAVAPVLALLVAAGAVWLHAHPAVMPGVAAQLASPASALAGAGLVLVATALVAAAARGAPLALPGIILFAAFDLGVYGLSYLREPYPPARIEEFVRGQAQPPGVSGGRIQSTNNILTMAGARLADGYVAFVPVRFLDPLDGQRLRVAGVRWVQTKPPWRSAEPDTSKLPNWAGHVAGRVTTRDALGGTSLWAEVMDPMPRAWLVSRAVVSADPRRDIGSIDIATTALIASAVDIRAGPSGAVKIVADEPGHVRATATAATPQLLILSESWHRGWEVRVGGEARPVVRVFGDFVGCVVGPGEQEVEFSFRPRSFRIGAWVSLASSALMLLIAGLAWRAADRRSPHGRPV